MTTPKTAIRPCTEDDLAALARILLEVHATDGYPVEGVADPMAWLHGDGVLASWVATVDQTVVGHVSLSEPAKGDIGPDLARQAQISGPLAVLGRLFISPDARGLRLGAALTRAATDYAQRDGRRAVLDVMDKDTAARRTYEALGWRPLGHASHVYGDGASEPATAYLGPLPDATPLATQ